MKKILVFAALALLLTAPLFSQEADSNEEMPDETIVNEEDEFEYKLNQKGDMFLQFTMGGSLPLNFPDVKSVFKGTQKLGFGGIFGLSFNYFLSEEFILGGELNFGFNNSIANHVFNYIPIMFFASYQFSKKNWEIPLKAGLGLCVENFIGYHYPGLIGKVQAGVFYRLAPSWSLGLEGAYYFMPQFDKVYTNNIFVGNFAGLSLSLRYHF